MQRQDGGGDGASQRAVRPFSESFFFRLGVKDRDDLSLRRKFILNLQFTPSHKVLQKHLRTGRSCLSLRKGKNVNKCRSN